MYIKKHVTKEMATETIIILKHLVSTVEYSERITQNMPP